MSKRVSVVIMSLIANLTIFARDSYPLRSFDNSDIGLPKGNEVGIGLVIAIIAIPIGYLILNASSPKSGEDNSFGGCLGMIFIIGGVVCLLPLVAWLCAIGSAILGIILALFVIFGIIVLLTNKKK